MSIKELAEASGSNSLSEQMIFYFQRLIAEDQKDIEDMTKCCKEIAQNLMSIEHMTTNWCKETELPVSEEELALLRMLYNHDLERAKTYMQMINETEAGIRQTTAFIEQSKHM